MRSEANFRLSECQPLPRLGSNPAHRSAVCHQVLTRERLTHCVLDDGTSVNVTQSMDGAGGGFATPINYLVIAHGPDGAVLDTIASLPGPRLGSLPQFGGFLSPLFNASSLVAARSSTVAMTTALEPEVRLLDGEFQLRRIVRWSDPGREVTDAHVQAHREDYIAETGGPGSRGWTDGNEAQISDLRPVAELFPTASDLMIGWECKLHVTF